MGKDEASTIPSTPEHQDSSPLLLLLDPVIPDVPPAVLNSMPRNPSPPCVVPFPVVTAAPPTVAPRMFRERSASMTSDTAAEELNFPSLGSRGHHVGQCKPCAFLYSEEGCENGLSCVFCHLCPPGEKKRRQK